MSRIPEEVYTVTAVNKMAKFALEESFASIWVEGEISNYHHHGSGHRYFSLKDDQSQLSCAMWRSYAQNLKFLPKDGLKILANGTLTIYEQGGRYQLMVKRLLPAGMGELELAFRQLHEKLEKEGLFDPAIKKHLPLYPMRIGLVTSPTGAVIHDIIRVIKRRNPKIDIILWPSEVQGDLAPAQLAEGIRHFNEYQKIDLMIVGRGGGSLEDLWAFNDERVVRAVFQSRIPIISAVGHEVDKTLTDLAADYSAATPSMAAEVTAWPLDDFKLNLNTALRDLDYAVASSLKDIRCQFIDLIKSPVMKRPEAILENRYQFLDNQIRLLHLLSINRYDNFKKAAITTLSRLETLSPLAVLARGYTVTRAVSGKALLRSINQIKAGDHIETVVPDGLAVSVVQKAERKKPER
jgi:exodeoxyribonuclease VII large subunit